jgi:hypothetical protein
MLLGNLAWELAQLPLYTLWKTGSAGEIGFAVLHCTVGDVLIAAASLVGSLLVAGGGEWPRKGFVPVAAVALIAGIGVTAAIERLSTTRGIWTYSDLMPVFPGTGIGIAPLMQWIVIPGLAFAFVWSRRPPPGLDLTTMGIPKSVSPPDHLALSRRRTS